MWNYKVSKLLDHAGFDRNPSDIACLTETIILDSQLIWSPWKKYSTVNLQSNELSDYIRKIFTRKFDNNPKNEPWIVYGIQGVDISYVSILYTGMYIQYIGMFVLRI